MLRLLTSNTRQCCATAKKLHNFAGMQRQQQQQQKQLQLQQHWLITPIVRFRSQQHFNFTSSAENKKISPLGWFLLLVPITTFGLGTWQVQRKAWKENIIKELHKRKELQLPENLHEIADKEYHIVKVRGRYLHDKELLIGPRALIIPPGGEGAGKLFTARDAGNGFLVITPFQLADRDEIILVNRGWVSRQQINPETRAAAQINDEIELTGIIRGNEKRMFFSPDHKNDIFLYRDLTKMCELTGAVPLFIDATYDATVPGGPIAGQTRIAIRNDHLSYLITWYSLSAATALLWYHRIYKATRL